MARQTFADTGPHFEHAAASWAVDRPVVLSQRSTMQMVRPICGAVIFGADLLAIVVSYIMVEVINGGPLSALVLGKTGWNLPSSGPATLASGCFLLCYFAAKGHYSQRLSSWAVSSDLLTGSLCAATLAGFVAFLLQSQEPRWTTIGGWLLFLPLVFIARMAAKQALVAGGVWTIRIVIVGDAVSARRAIDVLKSKPELGYSIAAVVTTDRLQSTSVDLCWHTLMQGHRARLLIFSYQACDAPGRPMLETLVRQRVAFALMPDAEGLPVRGLQQTRFFSHDTTMSSIRNNLASPIARSVKLAFDFSLAATALVLLLPLFAVLIVLVRLDGGPALYRHKRLGRNAQPFDCLKFRSMVVDSEAVLRDVMQRDPAMASEWARSHKLTVDPRITPVGRFLRATSLDELPQLWNVLRLEMSIVGPRPIVPAEIYNYGKDIAFYYETRPGLTGLWQISGRAQTTYAKRVQLDTWYVKNWTLAYDLLIIFKTIPAVLRRQGAY